MGRAGSPAGATFAAVYPRSSAEFAHRLGGRLPEIVASVPDVAQAADVLAVLAEAAPVRDLDPTPLIELGQAATLLELRMLLEAAYGASPDLATAIANGLGGEQALLARLEEELPWVRNARLETDDTGRAVARANYTCISDDLQPDPHAEVVEVTRWLRALAPSSEVAASRAADVTGAPAGYGDAVIADLDHPSGFEPAGIRHASHNEVLPWVVQHGVKPANRSHSISYLLMRSEARPHSPCGPATLTA